MTSRSSGSRSGASPPRPPPGPEERKARRDRAIEQALDVRPLPQAPFPTLEVRNPERRTRYEVLLPAYPARDAAMCTCPDFSLRSVGTCKHLEAAWLHLRDHPLPTPYPVPPTGFAEDLWLAWERTWRGNFPRADRARMRAAGRHLIEMGEA